MRHATALSSDSHTDCVDRAVTSPERSTQAWIEWVPLVALTLAALVLGSIVVPWVFMWLLAIAMYAGFKWQTFWSVCTTQPVPNWRRGAAYLLLWPGMDPKPFFAPVTKTRHIQPREWIAASAKLIAGAAFVVIAKSTFPAGHPLAVGWMAMIGLILFLHFGALQFVALGWQGVGVRAEPIMNRPAASKSLSDLWGKRWNRGFRTLAHKLIFRPVERRCGRVAGILATFLASGLVHDLAISVPARAGYGLPTAYFLIQGLGIVIERSRMGAICGLGDGVAGRLWIVTVAAVPLPLLFHSSFVIRVMLPFLHAI